MLSIPGALLTSSELSMFSTSISVNLMSCNVVIFICVGRAAAGVALSVENTE